jgi:hypothetical protein
MCSSFSVGQDIDCQHEGVHKVSPVHSPAASASREAIACHQVETNKVGQCCNAIKHCTLSRVEKQRRIYDITFHVSLRMAKLRFENESYVNEI